MGLAQAAQASHRCPFLEAFKVGWGPGKSKLVKAAPPMARGVGTS